MRAVDVADLARAHGLPVSPGRWHGGSADYHVRCPEHTRPSRRRSIDVTDGRVGVMVNAHCSDDCRQRFLAYLGIHDEHALFFADFRTHPSPSRDDRRAVVPEHRPSASKLPVDTDRVVPMWDVTDRLVLPVGDEAFYLQLHLEGKGAFGAAEAAEWRQIWLYNRDLTAIRQPSLTECLLAAYEHKDVAPVWVVLERPPMAGRVMLDVIDDLEIVFGLHIRNGCLRWQRYGGEEWAPGRIKASQRAIAGVLDGLTRDGVVQRRDAAEKPPPGLRRAYEYLPGLGAGVVLAQHQARPHEARVVEAEGRVVGAPMEDRR